MTLAIQLEDLHKTFGHTVRALDGVSFGSARTEPARRPSSGS